MNTDATDASNVNNDPLVSDDERSLYRLLAYFFVSWLLLSELGRRLLPGYIGPGVAAFIVTLGSWFVGRSKRSKLSFASWLGLSVVTGVVVAGGLYLLGRLWPVV